MPRTPNTTATSEVENQIVTFVEAGETFTSLHVTNALRKAEAWAGTYGHMTGIAPVVRDLYDTGNPGYGDYVRTSVFIGGTQVFAYHPPGDDPTTVDLYQSPVPRVDIGTVGSVGRPSNSPRGTGYSGLPSGSDAYNGGRQAADGDEVSVPFNADGDAQIPRAMTRLIGLDEGDPVVVEGAHLSGRCILRRAEDGDTPFARLQPASGALRLRDSRLMPYGVGNADDLVVRVDASEGTITLR